MSRIRILPEVLSNKIAAGEVVERPASVVKELMENALDARSTRITIDIRNGGRALIQIADNGIGMNRDDALLALERYATSKIADDRDLFAIRTLGFRGEALPSIASVSRFTMITRDIDSDTGTRIVVTGGRIDKVTETGAPVGTLISVKQLFFNTPARRKFLKTVNTELGHIADSVAAMAMGRPTIRIRLRHNEKILKDWPAVAEPVDRVTDILGKDVQHRLYPVAGENNRIRLSGWIGSPDIFRSTARGIYLYVNGRMVRDRVIRHALFTGYAGRLMKGRYPLAVLFVDLPPGEVDVNVHPTKHEVRFARQRLVHDLVATAVADTLKCSERIPWQPSPDRIRPQETVTEPITIYEPSTSGSLDHLPPTSPVLSTPVDMRPPASDPAGENRRIQPERLIQPPLVPETPAHRLRMIGQFQGTYILCEWSGENGKELILIDQHAAHERIVFEALKKRYHAGEGPVQRLMIPETIELNFTEARILDGIRPDLARLGMDIAPFGQNTYVIKAVPALLGDGEMAPLIREILEQTAETGQGPGLEQSLDACLILMACHRAIRARQQLTEAEQQALVDQLVACDDPAHCPHGRPAWIRWPVKDLEKLFGRIS
ncbi:MAG: DNA mismatch repair endonuclease MutL [Deltaproteobacteria bacterium]|nr:MAG: DNA mismatch repair endonuclease MutL [Deltaproteobacteria bacterium]